jgi:hypothetical protein
MPSHAPPKQAPSKPPAEEQATESPKSLVERISVGATSREWRLPFDARISPGSKSPTFIGPNESEVARNACEFLGTNAPQIFTPWKASYFAAYPEREAAATSARHFNLPVASRALIEIEPKHELDKDTPSIISRRHPLAPPRAIELPDITDQHWYYKRHFNIGNYVMGARDPHAASVIEAQQDVASLRHYLSRYDELAKNTTGQNLFEATTWAAFRAPYFSCMEMCIKDLQLPSHFLALIHYGIGAHLAIGQRFPTWNASNLPPQEDSFLKKTHAVFSAIAAMYREDFPL